MEHLASYLLLASSLGTGLQQAFAAISPSTTTACMGYFKLAVSNAAALQSLCAATPAPQPTAAVPATAVAKPTPETPSDEDTGFATLDRQAFRAAKLESTAGRTVDGCFVSRPMLILCGFRSLPSQSQVSDSLPRICSEALFGAQRRVVWPLRSVFQALLRGCTILPIISCSSVALSKCLQMVGQHRPIRVHTGRDVVLYLFGSCPTIHGTLALVHNESVLCISCTVAGSSAIQWVALSIIVT